MQWESFSKACPQISEVAQARFIRDQLVMVGTLRRDGWPRVSPCEIDIAAGHLCCGMMWRATKGPAPLPPPPFANHNGHPHREGNRRGVEASRQRGGVRGPAPPPAIP